MKRFAVWMAALAILLMTSVAFAAEWTGMLEKSGDTVVFKSGEKTLNIANPEKATGYEGQNVKVTGTLNDAGDTVTIDAVAAA